MKDFQSQTFCLTGVIPGIARADILSHIAARDGEFTDRMNKSVTILVVGERGQGTNKYEKALQYGIEIMEYEEFMRWMMHTPLVDKDAHLVNLHRGSSRKYLGGAHVVPPSALRHRPSFDEWLKSKVGSMADADEGQKAQGESVEVDEGQKAKDESQEVGESQKAKDESQPSALSPQPSFDWSKVWDTIAAIFIILYKGMIVLAGLSICVVLWLIGIPASPSSLPR